MLDNNPGKLSQLPPDHDVVRMSPEEERIFKECSKEAFVKRGIPYGTVAALGAYSALKYGVLKPNARYGYAPAIATAGFVGSFIGIFTYKAMCIQKVLDHPNSTLRQKMEATLKKRLAPEEPHIEPQASMVSTLQMDDYQPSNDFDGFTGVNTDNDQHDDIYTMEPLGKYVGPSTTYDELRQKNREDYLRSQFTGISREQDNTRYARQPAPIREGDSLPFDHDRVPQYQLGD